MNPLFQEDEVAYASTIQGGARGVRTLVPAWQNQQHQMHGYGYKTIGKITYMRSVVQRFSDI
jgi:hypothetical protein